MSPAASSGGRLAPAARLRGSFPPVTPGAAGAAPSALTVSATLVVSGHRLTASVFGKDAAGDVVPNAAPSDAAIGGTGVVNSPAQITVIAALQVTRQAPSTTLTVGTAYPTFAPVVASVGTAPVTYPGYRTNLATSGRYTARQERQYAVRLRRAENVF